MTHEGYRPCTYYPVLLNLEGKEVVIVGGGRVAERKVNSLVESGAKVVVISPEVTRAIEGLSDRGKILLRRREFLPSDLDGAWLVISATDDPFTQKQVFKEASGRRLFCNVVDQPELCSFIVPSVVRRGSLCISISTGGKSPALAKGLRKRIEGDFGQHWAIYTELLGMLREMIVTSTANPEERKRICSCLADMNVADWIQGAKWQEVERWAVSIAGPRARDIVSNLRKRADVISMPHDL